MLLCLQVRMLKSRLLQRNLRDVKLPPRTITEIVLSRMAVALAAILDLRLSSRSE